MEELQTPPESREDLNLWFVTLTAPPDQLSGSLSKKIVTLSEELRQPFFGRLRYSTHVFSYLWVLERGTRDWWQRPSSCRHLHYHMLIWTDADKRQLESKWHDSGGGFLNVQKVGSSCRNQKTYSADLRRVLWYMSKGQFSGPEGPSVISGKTTNSSSQDLNALHSDVAKRRQEQAAREQVVEGLVRGNLDERPVCDRKCYRMYLRRISLELLNEKVRTFNGETCGTLLWWSEDEAFVNTEDSGTVQVDPFLIVPLDRPVPKIHRSSERPPWTSDDGERTTTSTASGTLEKPEPQSLEDSESIFRFEEADGSVTETRRAHGEEPLNGDDEAASTGDLIHNRTTAEKGRRRIRLPRPANPQTRRQGSGADH